MKRTEAGAEAKSDLHLRRWLLNMLRAAHIVAIVGLGAEMLGAPAAQWPFPLAAGTGLGMLALDYQARRSYAFELTGVWMALKLVLIASLGFAGAHRPFAFWGVLLGSVLVAHAPGNFRHLRWRGQTDSGNRN
ncbi:MAG: hypothetical protein KF778_00710 [Rhodocyclaceae bacterium]|nr:hypothetical protein [Rhodocyclaceae bacterium]MBX3666900.1 hypothetical protein [Rhodocyclaceae bacterium]